jgi:hypothetical protein
LDEKGQVLTVAYQRRPEGGTHIRTSFRCKRTWENNTAGFRGKFVTVLAHTLDEW